MPTYIAKHTYADIESAKTSMNLGYDIFKKLDDGSPLWIMQAATLAEAKKSIEGLVHGSPAQYFIRDASSGEVILSAGRTPLT